ncbi:hypothetical protein [Haloactinopolyspora alba]|nr:hypothetical protein [Haloactinopolyspora alba]
MPSRAVDVDPGASSTSDVDFAAAPAWSAWKLMPPSVQVRLKVDARLDPIVAIVNGAKEPVVRKRGDRYVERAYAWSVDHQSLAVVDASRQLERMDGARFRPVESWQLTVRRRPFVGEVRQRSGTVPADRAVDTDVADTSGGPGWVDVIDLLPAPVRAQVRAVVPKPEVDFDVLLQGNERGVPADHEAGLVRATANMMIAVSATQTIQVRRRMPADEAERQLAVAPWDVTTVTAQLGPERIIELDADRSLGDAVGVNRAELSHGDGRTS